MNLKLSRALLAAAEEQPHGFLRVRGRDMAREVELLASAGFVEGSVHPGEEVPTAVIKRVTGAGEELLRSLSQEHEENGSARWTSMR